MNTTTSNEQGVLAAGLTPQYCKIVSKASDHQGLELFITATADGKATVKNELNDDTQVWFKKLMRKDTGAYALVNKKQGTCIKRVANENGTPLQLVDIEQATDELALWLDDSVPGKYNAIKSLVNFEQKINIPGSGPYIAGAQLVSWKWSRAAPNELWKFENV